MGFDRQVIQSISSERKAGGSSINLLLRLGTRHSQLGTRDSYSFSKNSHAEQEM